MSRRPAAGKDHMAELVGEAAAVAAVDGGTEGLPDVRAGCGFAVRDVFEADVDF